MNKTLAFLCFISAFVILGVAFPEGVVGILLVLVCGGITIVLIRKNTEDKVFLTNIFLVALLARLFFATVTHVFNLQEFFGGDALQYDEAGARLVAIWMGYSPGTDFDSVKALSTSQPGWGMNYITGFIYLICGRSMLAGQFFCAVIGAATAPMVYTCAHEIFRNQRVSKISAILVAVFPAFIVWSSQLLKDGLIIFLLVLAMTMVLKLQKKFGYVAVILLGFSLFGILALRFYIFYIVGVAVAGSFIIGSSSSVKSIVRGFISLVILGAALTYIGALQSAGNSLEKYGSLERVQASRQDYSKSNSGFGEELDVSTPIGAISAMPLGFAYLMLAPFPWQISNVRQAITLPEMLLWWASLPILISGLWFTIRTKLRNSIAILLFSLMLTLAYSIFQGNVGTAYRQRAQIQVFLFIFIAVGWTLILERRENNKLAKTMKQQQSRLKRDTLGLEEIRN
jgi:4-amino-4-deoxy-L-arabinose transferase-like glycosyltransferase